MRSFTHVLLLVAAVALVMAVSAKTSAQKARANATAVAVTQQPLISEYRGIRLGMTTDQVRTKLGAPALKADDQDYYIFSETETAQFAYDAAHKVFAISADYTGPAVPDYRNVTGPLIEQRPDGSLYQVVRYEALGFWVSYNHSTNGVVTVTIQKI